MSATEQDPEMELRERVARAIWEASNPAIGLVLTAEMRDTMWRSATVSPLRDEYRRIADAAIAVILPALAERLEFTPLSQRESGVIDDYTAGMHAAAKILRLLAAPDCLAPSQTRTDREENRP